MTQDERETIAARLKEARERAGLSQGQVAKRLNLHRPTVSEIEAGRRRIAAEELDEFAALYRVSVEWLVRGSDTDANAEEVLLAARKLSKWSESDLKKLEELIRMLRKPAKRRNQ
ncbi:MAG TPA: helix-turn-helix transcriptional regulator [Pirellulaceae bacterium]|jgi:transcriptional regulator with XRE-family HTH domain